MLFLQCEDEFFVALNELRLRLDGVRVGARDVAGLLYPDGGGCEVARLLYLRGV